MMPLASKIAHDRISVAICTYNPRRDYLDRVLTSLKSQTLPSSQWDLLIIDNCSEPPVAESFNLDWHPSGRIIRENELGIANARIRAMTDFGGELLVFLDDDNVIADNYLECCLRLFAERPDLGAVSGCLMPEYEVPPPEWLAPYESWIAIRRIKSSTWSNFFDSRSEPVTAGMCLRRKVAEAHIRSASENPMLQLLGSRGRSLMRGEDVAISKTALKLGCSIGQFPQLQLLHLIPKSRLAPDYLFSLYRHLCASGRLMGWIENPKAIPPRFPDWRFCLKAILRLMKGSNIDRRLVVEDFRAISLARAIAKEALRIKAESGH